jgi:hypothetical protein
VYGVTVKTFGMYSMKELFEELLEFRGKEVRWIRACYL